MEESARPTLKQNGFTEFRGLQAFRFEKERVDVLGCIPFGVAEPKPALHIYLEVGTFLRFVPHYSGASFVGVDGLALKGSIDCHFRMGLGPSWWLKKSWNDRAWEVRSDGWRLRKVLADMDEKVRVVGLPWFSKFDDLKSVYRAVLADQGSHRSSPDSWGEHYGTTLLRACLANKLKDWKNAVGFLGAAIELENPAHTVDSDKPRAFYHALEPDLRRALAEAERQVTLDSNRG